MPCPPAELLISIGDVLSCAILVLPLSNNRTFSASGIHRAKVTSENDSGLYLWLYDVAGPAEQPEGTRSVVSGGPRGSVLTKRAKTTAAPARTSPRPQVPRCDKEATSAPRHKHPPDYGRRYWGGCNISGAPVVTIWNVRLSRE